MGIRNYKPTSPGRRVMTDPHHRRADEEDSPRSALTGELPKRRERNNRGDITVRHRGGGHKRRYRIIDFRRDKRDDPGQGRGHRVRPEPVGAHRAAALRGRREALHPRSGRT